MSVATTVLYDCMPFARYILHKFGWLSFFSPSRRYPLLFSWTDGARLSTIISITLYSDYSYLASSYFPISTTMFIHVLPLVLLLIAVVSSCNAFVPSHFVVGKICSHDSTHLLQRKIFPSTDTNQLYYQLLLIVNHLMMIVPTQ